MSNLQLKLACGPYDRTSALVHGQVTLSGADLTVVEMEDTAKMFRGMFQGEFDASEMSLAELVYYTSRGTCDFIGIPVFPSRVFRHGFIFYNTGAAVTGPGDLEGKRIGFSKLVQTAVVWIRGMLVEEFGIPPSKTSLHVASLDPWSVRASDSLETRDGSPIRVLEKLGASDANTLGLALQKGLVNVIGTTRVPGFFGKDPSVKRLFEDYRSAEVAYFRRTRIFPIMHVLVVRKSVVEQQPDLPVRLFDLFCAAKKRAYEWRTNPSSVSIAWHGAYAEQEQSIFEQDPWIYGLAPNAHVIEKFLSYCDDLGVSDSKTRPKDLFDPSTWSLRDNVG